MLRHHVANALLPDATDPHRIDEAVEVEEAIGPVLHQLEVAVLGHLYRVVHVRLEMVAAGVEIIHPARDLQVRCLEWHLSKYSF